MYIIFSWIAWKRLVITECIDTHKRNEQTSAWLPLAVWLNFNEILVKLYSRSAPVASMERLLAPLVVFAAMLLSHPGFVSTLTRCPWDMRCLLRWSDARTWDDHTVPREHDEVRIHFRLNCALIVCSVLVLE